MKICNLGRGKIIQDHKNRFLIISGVTPLPQCAYTCMIYIQDPPHPDFGIRACLTVSSTLDFKRTVGSEGFRTWTRLTSSPARLARGPNIVFRRRVIVPRVRRALRLPKCPALPVVEAVSPTSVCDGTTELLLVFLVRPKKGMSCGGGRELSRSTLYDLPPEPC